VDISRSFSYIFDDSDWVGKLVIIAVMTLLTIFVPLIGLIALAALLGYVVELARNVRDDILMPLPQWDTYGDKIANGGNVLVAYIIYNLPNVLIGCMIWFVPYAFGSGGQDSGISLLVWCCAGPLLLIYNLITWPMLAIGLIRYVDTGKTGEFFRFGDLFGTMRANSGLVLRWIIFSFLANLVLSLLAIIPCLGWIAAPALAVPVQGHLVGQLARELSGAGGDGKPKNKPKRQGPPQPQGQPPRPQGPPRSSAPRPR